MRSARVVDLPVAEYSILGFNRKERVQNFYDDGYPSRLTRARVFVELSCRSCGTTRRVELQQLNRRGVRCGSGKHRLVKINL